MSKYRLHRLKIQITQIIFLLFTLYYLLPGLCYAQSVKSADLIANAKDYDGKIVAYEGEAIGDLMNRGSFAWLNISESGNAIGIWLSKALSTQVKFIGGYKTKGDWIRIEGIFNRACLEHGGDLDIHARNLIVLKPGRKLKDSLPPAKKKLALYLGGMVLCLLIYRLYRLRQKKQLTIAQG